MEVEVEKASSSASIEEKIFFLTLIPVVEVEVKKEASSLEIEVEEDACFLTLIRVGEVSS